MRYSVTREIVDAFYDALAKRDYEAVASFIHDDIDWSIGGPVDVLPFCGQRHGKAAVMDVISTQVPAVLPTRKFVPDFKLVDGDRAAILGRLHAKHAVTGHTISYRISHFMRFKDDKLIEYASVLDSFDAAEQVLGHRISAGPDFSNARRDDLVAV